MKSTASRQVVAFRSLVALSLLLALAAPHAQGAIVVTEAMSSSGTGGTGDWIELTNTGATAVDITGYKMDDNSFLFANSVALNGIISIPAGKSAVFIESTTATPADEVTAFVNFWGAAALAGVPVGTYSGAGVGLSSTADGVQVFDAAGNSVNQVNFGVATTGVSFGYNPTTGTFGGLSVAGQFGAFVSANALANVGSPGAVPEPTGFVLGGMGLVGLGLLRKKFRARKCR